MTGEQLRDTIRRLLLLRLFEACGDRVCLGEMYGAREFTWSGLVVDMM